ncbi:MAG: metallophosphoesterase family protein [Cognatishimia sp.]
MKFLIVSDIHAISGDLFKAKAYGENKPSYCDVESNSPSENPILSIAESLPKYRGKIDALLCLGDLAHQAKRLPFAAAWQRLHEVAEQLDIRHVLGVTGNHDKASRSTDESDLAMQDYGQFITPSFPSSDKAFNDQYYKAGVASRDINNSRVICIDTCRLHGLGGEKFKEVFSIGSMTDAMIAKVSKLTTDSLHPTVIIMMHHHPDKVHPVFDIDDDVMTKGGAMFEELAKIDKKIIVLHGHKHMVAVNYKPGFMNDIPVLSAASLSCLPYSGDHELSANQFHIIDLDVAGNSQQKTGEILSWEWHVSKWKPSKKDYMTHVVPIGKSANITNIVQKLRALAPTQFLEKDELLNEIPEIEFATKAQIEEINEKFEGDSKLISIWMDSGGRLMGLKYEEIR